MKLSKMIEEGREAEEVRQYLMQVFRNAPEII